MIDTGPRPVPHKRMEITGADIGVYGAEVGQNVFPVSVWLTKPELGKVIGIQLKWKSMCALSIILLNQSLGLE